MVNQCNKNSLLDNSKIYLVMIEQNKMLFKFLYWLYCFPTRISFRSINRSINPSLNNLTIVKTLLMSPPSFMSYQKTQVYCLKKNVVFLNIYLNSYRRYNSSNQTVNVYSAPRRRLSWFIFVLLKANKYERT